MTTTPTNYPPFERPVGESVPLPITCLDRLKMELGHKPYADHDEMRIFLDENKLVYDWEYDKDTMEIQLIYSVIAILEMLCNNLDNYMRIETNFLTQNSALENLHKRIAHLRNRIKNLEEAMSEPQSCFTHMFHTHRRRVTDNA